MAEPVTNGMESEQINSLENGHNSVEVKKEKDSSSKSHSSSHKHSSSSSSHKHSSSSSHKKHKSDKDKHRSSHKSSHGDKERSSSSHKSSHGDKERSSSSHKSSHGDKERSSSSHKSSHKDKHRDKERSSSSKDGEKKHSSSSSGDKHSSSSKHSSSHKSSHRDKDREKHKSSSSSSKPKEERVQVKTEPVTPVKVEPEVKADMSDDDVPLTARLDTSKVKAEKRPIKMEDSDDEPLAERMEKKKVKKEEKSKKRKSHDEDYDEEFSPAAKKKKKVKEVKKEVSVSPTKRAGGKKKDEAQPERWRWWEEEEKEDGVKWRFLEHKGPVFAPAYEPLPDNVRFYYNGKAMRLSEGAEEVAGFYGRMIDHDYVTKQTFNENFFKDWRKVMTSQERQTLTDLTKCNFKEIDAYYKMKSEERKAMSKEEKKKIKEGKDAVMEEYGYCVMDGHREKMGNFNIEPPGLFRGRGDHPKMGMLKRRVMPEDIIINCSKDSAIPVPPKGHKWREVRHDNAVTWLASWTENIQNSTKYIMLAANSKLKGAKDWKKYETARSLHTKVDKIRAAYREDLKSKEMRIRQRSVAMYFIDKLALRAGNEKDEETADTVGCCSLRYEHIKLHEEKDGQQNVVEFDFLGKDSIRYHNAVPVDRRVFKNLLMFMDNKNDGDDLFDRLNTAILNKHLNTLMEGLTAKVFRTYNASRTLQEQLDLLTVPEDAVAAKILAYNRANRSVAILCNHQRAVSKNFSKQMENMQNKISAKKEAVHAAKKEYKQAKSDYKACKSEKFKAMVERKKKAVERLEEQLTKLEISLTDKDENKEIALGTSKLNYLDPRISVAWCKKWEVPIEKVYNKTQRDKFAWAIDMAEADYKFTEMD